MSMSVPIPYTIKPWDSLHLPYLYKKHMRFICTKNKVLWTLQRTIFVDMNRIYIYIYIYLKSEHLNSRLTTYKTDKWIIFYCIYCYKIMHRTVVFLVCVLKKIEIKKVENMNSIYNACALLWKDIFAEPWNFPYLYE